MFSKKATQKKQWIPHNIDKRDFFPFIMLLER